MADKEVPERIRWFCEAIDKLTFDEMTRVAEVFNKALGSRNLSDAKVSLALSQASKKLNDATNVMYPNPDHADEVISATPNE